jgi:hypothetical protein
MNSVRLAIALLTLAAAVNVHAGEPAVANIGIVDDTQGTSVASRWSPARLLEGVWDTRSSFTNCASGAVLASSRGTLAFNAGGTLTAMNSTPPMAISNGLGAWWHTHGRSFAASFRVFTFAPDGTYTGTRIVNQTLSLDAAGDTLSQTVDIRIFDIDDHPIGTGCATGTGTRLF